MEQERVREHSLFFCAQHLQSRRNLAEGNLYHPGAAKTAVAPQQKMCLQSIEDWCIIQIVHYCERTKDNRKSRRSLRIPRQTAARTKER